MPERPERIVETARQSVSLTGIDRRDFVKYAAATLALLVSPAGRAAASSMLAVRVWPARDYTRMTLEYQQPLRFSHMVVKNPERLVIDLEGVEFNSVLQNLAGKISETDPYIKLIRAGRYKPDVVRIVVELKTEITPQVFTLAPVGEYAHRLVIDLYPTEPVDPLLALLEKSPAAEQAAGEAARDRSDVRGEERHDAKAEPRSEQRGRARARDDDEPPPVARLVTVVIDPGHGGEDPGAVGRRGTYEKDVTLSVARHLKAKIDTEPNMRSLLTRDADFFIPLQQRVAKARRVRADLFVSIHADAFIKSTARGSSVFVLSENGASSSAARWLAQRENAADLIGGVNLDVKDPHLARTLLDLSQTATINDSLKLGKSVLSELGNVNTLHKPHVEQAGFAVLKAPDIPSILVETAFISNPEEEKRLNNEAYQNKMAEAIVRGIKRYFAKNPPLARQKLAMLD
jgi:N-acetylmuramoyl-L-alanine amidase